MKIVSDARFHSVRVPETFAELFDLFVGTLNDPAPVYMWRGQADASWLIHSGAHRKMIAGGRLPTEENVAAYEGRLLVRATHRGFRFYNGRELPDFELLARLQHHGAATRLIDTTRSALTGLWFACAGLPDRDGMLFGLHSDFLGGGEGGLAILPYREQIKLALTHNHPQTWEPPTVSERVSAQRSQFVYSEMRPDGVHGSLAMYDIDRSLLAIRVPAAWKPRYLNMLRSSFDVSASTLFPDLDGFGLANSADVDDLSLSRW